MEHYSSLTRRGALGALSRQLLAVLPAVSLMLWLDGCKPGMGGRAEDYDRYVELLAKTSDGYQAYSVGGEPKRHVGWMGRKPVLGFTPDLSGGLIVDHEDLTTPFRDLYILRLWLEGRTAYELGRFAYDIRRDSELTRLHWAWLTPNGTRLVLLCDGSLRRYEAQGGRLRATVLADGVRWFAPWKDRVYFLLAGSRDVLRWKSLADGAETGEFRLPAEFDRVIVGGPSGEIVVCQGGPATGGELTVFTEVDLRKGLTTPLRGRPDGAVVSFVLLPRGRQALVEAWRHAEENRYGEVVTRFYLWDFTDGRLRLLGTNKRGLVIHPTPELITSVI